LAPVTGWRLQFEQNAEKGLQLYFTPLQGTADSHVLPIGVRWNPATKRYDRWTAPTSISFLESPALNTAIGTAMSNPRVRRKPGAQSRHENLLPKRLERPDAVLRRYRAALFLALLTVVLMGLSETCCRWRPA